MLDIAMAYASFGKFEGKFKLGERVPVYWGTDSAGQATTDPKAVLEGGMSSPIGGHKGFGLALLTEIITGVLSGGEILDEGNSTLETAGVYAQTAIAIKVEGFMPIATFRQRTADLITGIQTQEPQVQIPGQRSFLAKQHSLANGLQLDSALIIQLNQWATRLGVAH